MNDARLARWGLIGLLGLGICWLGGLSLLRLLDRAIVEQDETYYANLAWTWQTTGTCTYGLLGSFAKNHLGIDLPYWYDRVKWLYVRPLGLLFSLVGGPDVMVGRTYSLLAALAALCLTVWAVTSTIGPVTGCVVAFLFVTDSRTIWSANLIRTEAWLGCLTAAVTWLILDRPITRSGTLAAGFLGGLGAGIHPNGIGLGLGLLAGLRWPGYKTPWRPLSIGVALGWVMTFLLVLGPHRLPGFIEIWAGRTTDPSAGTLMDAPFWEKLAGFVTGGMEAPGVLIPPLVNPNVWIVGFSYAVLRAKNEPRVGAMLVASVMVFLWLGLASYRSMPLYLAMFLPLFLVPIGWGIAALCSGIGTWISRRDRLTIVLVCVVVGWWLPRTLLFGIGLSGILWLSWYLAQRSEKTLMFFRRGATICGFLLLGAVVKSAHQFLVWTYDPRFLLRHSQFRQEISSAIPKDAKVLGAWPYWIALYPRAYQIDALPYSADFATRLGDYQPDVILVDGTFGDNRLERVDWLTWLRKHCGEGSGLRWTVPAIADRVSVTGSQHIHGPIEVYYLKWPRLPLELIRARRARSLAIDGIRAVIAGRPDQGSRLLEQARSLDAIGGAVDGALAEAYFELAAKTYKRGALHEAKSLLGRVLVLNPHHSMARNNLRVLESLAH